MTPFLYLWGFLMLLAAPQGAAPPQERTYVGQDSCVGCHEAEGTGLHQTAHGKVQNPRAPAADKGCESCHGPGSAHIEDPSIPDSIKRFAQMKPRDVSDTCLACHSRGNHTQWKGSMH